jgi:hypothetical protein
MGLIFDVHRKQMRLAHATGHAYCLAFSLTPPAFMYRATSSHGIAVSGSQKMMATMPK